MIVITEEVTAAQCLCFLISSVTCTTEVLTHFGQPQTLQLLGRMLKHELLVVPVSSLAFLAHLLPLLN